MEQHTKCIEIWVIGSSNLFSLQLFYFFLAFPFCCVCLHWSIWPVRITIGQNKRANWYFTILSILIKVKDRVQNRTYIISNDNAKCRFSNRLNHDLNQVAFTPCIFCSFYLNDYAIHYMITCNYNIYSNITGLHVLAFFSKIWNTLY